MCTYILRRLKFVLVTEGTLSAVLHGGVASSLHGGGGAGGNETGSEGGEESTTIEMVSMENPLKISNERKRIHEMEKQICQQASQIDEMKRQHVTEINELKRMVEAITCSDKKIYL